MSLIWRFQFWAPTRFSEVIFGLDTSLLIMEERKQSNQAIDWLYKATQGSSLLKNFWMRENSVEVSWRG